MSLHGWFVRFVAIAVCAGLCFTTLAMASQEVTAKRLEGAIGLDRLSAQAAAGCEVVQYDNGSASLAWQLPSAGADPDTMIFVHFAPKFACTLKTVQFWLGDGDLGLVGTPDVRVSVYSAAGGLPDTLIASVVVPFGSLDFCTVFGCPGTPNQADFSAFNLTFAENFCVVLQRSGTAADTLSFLTDAQSPTTRRSGAFTLFNGAGWIHMLDLYGAEYNWLVRAELCCGDPPTCTPGSQPDWPTYGGSYQRTFRSTAAVSNECRLTLDWISQGDDIVFDRSAYTNVVVSDSLAFLSFDEYMACYNVHTGDTIWKFRDLGRQVVGQGLRCNVTVDDSLAYVGGGALRAFSCLRVADGSLKWTRNLTGNPLSLLGPTNFAPSVIVGNVVYTASERQPNGEVFALDKFTGNDHPGWSTNPVILSEGWVQNGLTTDGDSLLFLGTASSADVFILTNGRLYALRTADGSPKWELEDPSAKVFDIKLDEEGFAGALAYEDGILYYQSTIRDDLNGVDHFPWDGSAGAIDVNAEDGNGAGILWVVQEPVGRGAFGGPTLGDSVVYLNNDGIWVSSTGVTTPTGVIAVRKSNGAVLWRNSLGGFGVPMPLTVTCEAGANPYVFAGTRGGEWYMLDGFTGDVVWRRTFSGIVHGTVVLDSQVLVSTRTSFVGNTNGQLASFKLLGTDRPRMDVTQETPFAANIVPGTGLYRDTIYGALENVGCANLTLSDFGVDTLALSYRVTSIDPRVAARAERVAGLQTPGHDRFADALAQPVRPGQVPRKDVRLRSDLLMEDALPARPATATAAGVAAPLVVAVETPTPATVTAGSPLDIALRINEAGQTPRTTVRNFVVLDHDDPDYLPEDTGTTLLGLPFITVDAIFGYAEQQDTLRAMDALSLVTNHGAYGDENADNFYVEGDFSVSLYDGTFLITGKLNDTPFTAWDIYESREFLPDTVLTISYDTILGTFTGADTVRGTIVRSRFVDSVGFNDGLATHSFGTQVWETQVGLNLIGQGIGSFKLIEYQVINRNAAPVDSVIYLGSFMDWDIESFIPNRVEDTLVDEWATVYQWDPSLGNSVYGITKLPKPGTVYEEPNGTRDTATGFYSVYGVDNPTEVWTGAPNAPIVDSIYSYLSRPGVNSLFGLARDTDMSIAVVLDTVHLEANDTVYVRCALFGSTDGGDLTGLSADMAAGANLVAGFRRGDVNGDGNYNFLDLVYLYRYVNSGGTSLTPIPRVEQGDVNLDGNVDQLDVDYLEEFLYGDGPAPVGQWWW